MNGPFEDLYRAARELSGGQLTPDACPGSHIQQDVETGVEFLLKARHV